MKRANFLRLGILSLVCLANCISSGCQATPENEIVVNKSDDILKTKISAEPCPATTYSAPTTWDMLIPGITDEVNIRIDADIVVPNTNTFPVIRVAPAEITAEQAKCFIERLVDGCPVYDGRVEYTKKEILQFIANITDNIENPQSSFNQSYKSGTEAYNQRRAEFIKAIELWQERLEAAPEDDQERPLDYVFRKPGEAAGVRVQAQDNSNEPYFVEINGVTKNMGERMQSFVFSKNEEAPFNNQSITYRNLTEGLAQNATLNPQIEGLKNCNISVTNAEVIAQDFLRAIDITNMDIFLACSASQFNESSDADAKTIFDYSQCYVLYFTKKINGISVIYQSNSYSDNTQFELYWPSEYIRIVVNDRGISEFFWSSPYNELNIINKNVELLSFSAIQERIQQMIAKQIKYATDDPAVTGRDIIINRIVLGYVKIREKDTGEQMLVPAWSCYGYEVDHYSGQQPGGYILDENNCYTNYAIGVSYLVINAIDGSVIDMSLGY